MKPIAPKSVAKGCKPADLQIAAKPNRRQASPASMFRSAAEKHQHSSLLLLLTSRSSEIAETNQIARASRAVPEMTNDLVIQEF